MNPLYVVAIIMSVPPLVAAIASAIAIIKTMAPKLDHIIVLTNSTLSAANLRISAQDVELGQLKEVVNRLIAERDHKGGA